MKENEFAKMRVLYYVPEHGRSHYKVKCECGLIQDLYCWARVLRCGCGKLLHTTISKVDDSIQLTKEDKESLGLFTPSKIVTLAKCKHCNKDLVYEYGWTHKDGSEDCVAIPKSGTIQRKGGIK